MAAHHPVWMSRHTRGSRQDIHSTRVPHTEEGCGWLSSTHRHKESKPPHVHDGTGDQARSDVTLRQQPASVPFEQTIPSFRLYEQVCFQQRAGRCSKTRGLRWQALKADSTTTRHTRTDPAQRTLSQWTRTLPRHDHQLRFALDDREDVRETRQGVDHHHSAARLRRLRGGTREVQQDEDHHHSTRAKIPRQSDKVKTITKARVRRRPRSQTRRNPFPSKSERP